MLDLTFSWEFETIKYPEDITYDVAVGRKSRSAVSTSTFVSKVEKSVARESETLPTSRPGVDACRMSLCKLRRNGNKRVATNARKIIKI